VKTLVQGPEVEFERLPGSNPPSTLSNIIEVDIDVMAEVIFVFDLKTTFNV